MTTFDQREQAFEAQFVHDETLKFRALARRNRLLGLWAAEKLGKTGEAAELHAKEVVVADFEEDGDHDVFRKVRDDLASGGVTPDDAEIRRMMDELLAVAVRQVQTET